VNKDRAKGTIDEVLGSAKRKAGKLTGDTQLEIQGMAQEVKGRVENAWGKAKDVVQEANEEATVQDELRMRVELAVSATDADRNKNK
jgi:uncharacterized protein YjbJ (UPF0337 family)